MTMYTVPTLLYPYDALHPHISVDIMKVHHTKHHQTYVDKLNEVYSHTPELAGRSVESLLADISSVPEQARAAVRNNGGGHVNHTMFWQCMSPDGGGEPEGELARKLTERYGGYQQFVDEFTAKALLVFGSGWTWLQPNGDIITTPNQDTPLLQGLPEPVLGLDVWEHAYYLDYKSARADYVKAWWNVVNWEFVEQRYDHALSQ